MYIYVRDALKIHRLARELRPDFAFPELSEFRKAAYVAVFFSFTKYITKTVFVAMVKPWCKDQDNEEMLQARANKAGKKLWQTIFYLCTVTYGYKTLKDTPWLPWFLGGNGSWDGFASDLPFNPVPENVINYYMFELGYIGGAAIEHILFEERTNDFLMYFLHHICAVTLIIASYIGNFLGVGCLVLFHLDLADIFTASASGFGQTKYDLLAAINFFTLMAVWLYTRMLILPWIVYKIFSGQHLLTEPFASEGLDSVCQFSAFMLLLLAVMNYVWFYMFTQIAQKYITKGETEDLVGNLKKAKTQKLK